MPDQAVFDDLLIDHVELYVSDLDAARTTYVNGYGLGAYAEAGGGELPVRSAALGGQAIRLVLTEASGADHPSSAFVEQHGDGVAVIAMTTRDAAGAYDEAVRRGAAPVSGLAEHDGVVTASVIGFGDVVHTFVQRSSGLGPRILPGFSPTPGASDASPFGLRAIDHFAVCLEAGQLDPTVAFYERVFDFRTVFEELVVVGAQAMNSKVVQSRSGAVTLTLIEQDPTREPGQVDAFVKRHGGAGIQHIAFATDDIIESVGRMSEQGVRFLSTPATYYEAVERRLMFSRHSVPALKGLNVLVDEDHDGQLFQIFTRSTHPQGTLFMEVIERFGARTFGIGNIKALYEAVELQRIQDEEAE